MRRLVLLCLLWAVGAGLPLLAAGTVDHDLGLGLCYHRIHELPSGLPGMGERRTSACVVDVRYLQANPGAAMAFLSWLNFRATPQHPVFVLANAGTDASLLQPLRARNAAANFLVIGIPSGDFAPDIAARATAADERRAYDALERGAAIRSLLADYPDKIRNDEASLAAERTPVAENGKAGPENATAGPDDKASPPAPLIDATLQRAVQLHRALLALKRI